MPLPRRIRNLASFVLAWMLLSLAAAGASPLVHPKAMQVVCSSTGAVMTMVQADDEGLQDMGGGHLDCPLCMPATGAPPIAHDVKMPVLLPLGHVVRSIPAARLAAAVSAPLPARGPPSLS